MNWKHIYLRSVCKRRYLSELRTILSKVPLLSIVIALWGLNFLLLGNTTFRSGVLRGEWTFLSLLATMRPFSFRLASFGNKCHTGGGERFQTLILHFKELWDCLKGLFVFIMCHNNFKAFLMFNISENSNHT